MKVVSVLPTCASWWLQARQTTPLLHELRKLLVLILGLCHLVSWIGEKIRKETCLFNFPVRSLLFSAGGHLWSKLLARLCAEGIAVWKCLL